MEALVDLPKVMLKVFQKEPRKSTTGPKRLSNGLLKEALIELPKERLAGF
jgi:hypothetical protein